MAAEDDVDESSAKLRENYFASGSAEALASAIANDAKDDPELAARAAAVLQKQVEMLDEQTGVLRLQKEHLHKEYETLDEEQRLELSHLRMRRLSDYAKAALEVSAAIFILFLVVALGATVWTATRDTSVTIEGVSVPPDLAQRGLTGEVIANQLIDRVRAMEANTASVGSLNQLKMGGNDLKVQIPQTGVSIGELYRYLVGWLGQQTQVGGALYRTQAGYAMALRVGDDATTITGPESDLDKIVQKAAEHIYAHTVPLEYNMYLINADRIPEAVALARSMTRTNSGSRRLRAHEFAQLSIALQAEGRLQDGMVAAKMAAEIDPDDDYSFLLLLGTDGPLGHDESALAAARRASVLAKKQRDTLATESFERLIALAGDQYADETLGDYRGAIVVAQTGNGLSVAEILLQGVWLPEAADYAREHDPAKARAILRTMPFQDDSDTINVMTFEDVASFPFFEEAAERGDWRTALTDITALKHAWAKMGGEGDIYGALIDPRLALALAMNGDSAGALAVADRTPLDCYLCLRVRGLLRAKQQDWDGAARWFARAIATAPSPPFAYSEWGEMLLRQGRYDEAIAKFAQANQKGPHFADALELWGEALVLKNRSDLALEKFEEASKSAPRWGRLHLKWGEAFAYVGRAVEARAQFQLAASMDMNASDMATLRRWLGKAGWPVERPTTTTPGHWL